MNSIRLSPHVYMFLCIQINALRITELDQGNFIIHMRPCQFFSSFLFMDVDMANFLLIIYIYIYDYKPLNLSVKYNQSIHNKNSSYFHGKCHRPTVFVINILHVLFASYIHVHTEVGTVY
jgi:hypothetical protein